MASNALENVWIASKTKVLFFLKNDREDWKTMTNAA